MPLQSTFTDHKSSRQKQVQARVVDAPILELASWVMQDQHYLNEE
jgi:hypothetical protein